MAVQRYLATKDVKAARYAFNTSIIASVFVNVLLILLGFALMAYFGANSGQLPDGSSLRENADLLFPKFIVTGLPVGISGLVIAACTSSA